MRPLRRECVLCYSQDDFLRCGACKVARYCSREHQKEDWVMHKIFCKPVTKEQKNLDKEETALRAHPDRPFEEVVGQFWRFQPSRPYMLARSDFISALGDVNTYDSVACALDHSLDMLRLSLSDGMGVRKSVPSSFLRLGREQEAYDFIKGWAKYMQPDGGDNGMPPHTWFRDADVFEPVELAMDNYNFLNHALDLLLLKVKLLLDLLALQKSPFDMNSLLKTLVRNRIDELRASGLEALIEKVKDHIKLLCKSLKSQNSHIWTVLFNPEANSATTACYSLGSMDEARVAVHISYPAWAEALESLDWVENFVQSN
ncbi:hypothetical protein HDK64DRAFT_259158 [Phyllosticta capitalensis]